MSVAKKNLLKAIHISRSHHKLYLGYQGFFDWLLDIELRLIVSGWWEYCKSSQWPRDAHLIDYTF